MNEAVQGGSETLKLTDGNSWAFRESLFNHKTRV